MKVSCRRVKTIPTEQGALMAAPKVSPPMREFINASDELMRALARGATLTTEEERILSTFLPLLIDYVRAAAGRDASPSIPARF